MSSVTIPCCMTTDSSGDQRIGSLHEIVIPRACLAWMLPYHSLEHPDIGPRLRLWSLIQNCFHVMAQQLSRCIPKAQLARTGLPYIRRGDGTVTEFVSRSSCMSNEKVAAPALFRKRED